MAEKKQSTNQLHSVRNAFRILKCFREGNSHRTVKDLSEELGLSKSAVSRLLATMASEGFITKISGTHKFRLGTYVLSLSGVLTSSLEIHQETMPVLEKLVKKTNETAHLAVLENLHTVYLHKVDCNHPVQTLSHIGKQNPLHCTSSGKILSAYMSDDFIDKVITKGLEKYAPACITEPDVLRSQLKQIRKQGYAIEIEEFLIGVISISAPVRDYTGNVIAAINIVGPIQRINESNIPKFVHEVILASKEVSKRLGYFQKKSNNA